MSFQKKKDPLLNMSNPYAVSSSATLSSRQPTQSVPQTKPITQRYDLASGPTTQYGNNPTVQKPTVQAPTYSNPFLDTLKTSSNERISQTQSSADQLAKQLQESYQRQAQRTQSLAPLYQNQFNQFKSDTEADIAAEEQRGQREQAKTRDYYGEALRRSAQANREAQGQIQGVFANLNTIDSSGFNQQTLNQNARFVGGQQGIFKEQAGKLSDIDAAVSQYRREAQRQIQSENIKLQQQLVNIANTLDQGSMEYEQAIRKAYQDAKDRVDSISDTITQIEMQAYETQRQSQQTQLSPEFMRTGVPTNQTEYEFLIKNQDAVNKYTQGGSSNQAKQEVLGAIESVLNSPTGIDSVFGYGNLNPLNKLPGAGAQTTKANVDRLRSLISLENAQKLKGQGAITENERKLLADASTILSNPWISPEQAQNELARLYQQFGGTMQSSQSTMQGNDPLGLGL